MKSVLKSLAVLTALGCGAVGKDKLPESSGQGADAIPAESQVQFDEDLTFEGRLAQARGLPSSTPFVYEHEYLLILTQDAAMRLQPGEIATACPSGASLAGVYFTLTSNDGLFRATTDAVARPATPMAEHAFPGRVPKGTHVLKVSAYGTAPAPCTARSSFRTSAATTASRRPIPPRRSTKVFSAAGAPTTGRTAFRPYPSTLSAATAA